MKRLALALWLLPCAAPAQEICIKASEGFRFVRCVDMLGNARCEFLSARDDVLRCVAFDATGQPLAAANAFAAQASVLLHDVPAETITTLICD